MQNISDKHKIAAGQISFSAEKIHHYPLHLNQNLRLIYVLEGAIKITNVSGYTILNENDLEIINFNEPAEISAITTDNVVLIMEIDQNFLLKIDPRVDKLILNVGTSQFFISSERHLVMENIRSKQRLIELFFSLFEEYKRTNYREVSLKNLEHFCRFIIDHFEDVKKHLSCFSNADKNLIERFQRIDYFLQNNLTRRINLNDLVKLEHLTPQYISSEFKSKFNRSFINILEYYRVIMAVRLLINDCSLAVRDVAVRCGFADQKSLYKAFKKHMGCTPSVFKKKLNNIAIPETWHFDIRSEYILGLIKRVRGEIATDGNLSDKHTLKYDRLEWEEVEPGFYVGRERTNQILDHSYSYFQGGESWNLELEGDEVWFFHSGNPLHLVINNPAQKQTEEVYLDGVRGGLRIPVVSIAGGTNISVTAENVGEYTLISRIVV